jgi:hypothetical protein
MAMTMEFTLCGALEARRMIEGCFNQSLKGFQRAILEGNGKRMIYWKERIIHFIGELNWIDEIIINIRAADETASIK